MTRDTMVVRGERIDLTIHDDEGIIYAYWEDTEIASGFDKEEIREMVEYEFNQLLGMFPEITA